MSHYTAPLLTGNSELLAEARWLLEHAQRFPNAVTGWPSPHALTVYHSSGLSASTQGRAVSVLARAYQVTGDSDYLHLAQAAVQAFVLDIFDGGVNTPLGNEGLFFEDVAAYPATHELKGHLQALLGLYDYLSIQHENHIETLLQRGLLALDITLEDFDTGYWTRTNLLQGQLAFPQLHSLHSSLLQELAKRCENTRYALVALSWQRYEQHAVGRIHYHIQHHTHNLFRAIQRCCLRTPALDRPVTTPYRVCVPITAFPIPGGMRSVLAGVMQVMTASWRMTYLTHHKGEEVSGCAIETFGAKYASPWRFPYVWLYALSGMGKLAGLLYRESGCRLVLPQDGVFTGAFAACVGKLMGRHVVCMDHGNVTWLHNARLRSERVTAIQAYPKVRRVLARLNFAAYILSLRIMARIATRYTDLFLVAGDEVSEVYRYALNVPEWRIIRYAYTVDVTRFTPPDEEQRAQFRRGQGLDADAIVVSLINRLAPEKGLSFALEGIALAVKSLPVQVRKRLKVLIVGDGPLRPQLEVDIERCGLAQTCILWGSATPVDVIMLLGISDIFLYSGTRGTNYSMAVLEAMAASCAVIASTSPLSNATLLAGERGIAIAPGDAQAIGEALISLCNNPERRQQMGQGARAYVATHHSPAMLERALLRASLFTWV